MKLREKVARAICAAVEVGDLRDGDKLYRTGEGNQDYDPVWTLHEDAATAAIDALLPNELRQSIFYTREELRELLLHWAGTSEHDKRGAIEDAVRRLDPVPAPDDLDETP